MFLSYVITISQLFETYIRWLAFRKLLQPEQNRELWKIYSLWALAAMFLYVFLFQMLGINAATYKAVVMLGWLPYFLISLMHSRLIHQVFILSMGIITSLIQHTIGAIIILKIFTDKSESEMILMESVIYLVLFAIFLPLLHKYFTKLLANGEIFDIRPIGLYLAIFPLIIVSGHLIRLADGVLIHSWAERLSRIYLPFVFLFFYRHILNSTNRYIEKRRLSRNKLRLETQLKGLVKYNNAMEESHRQISVMRHDLRHNYNIILSMLENNDVEAALEHIRRQKIRLEQEKWQS